MLKFLIYRLLITFIDTAWYFVFLTSNPSQSDHCEAFVRNFWANLLRIYVLPQFTNPQLNLTSQILTLGLLLSTTALVFNVLASLIFSKLGSYFSGKFIVGHHIDGFFGLSH